jgi:hypothetical protein
MSKTKVTIKVKGTPKGVRKALSQITAEDVEPSGPILREADFRTKASKNAR